MSVMADPRHVLLKLVPALVLLGAACASAPDRAEAEPQSVHGCYYFMDSEADRAFRLPEGIRLTEEALTGWPAIMQRGNVRVAVTLTARGTADHPFGYWLEEDDGALEIGYPAGGGMVLDVDPEDGALVGTARALGDTAPVGGAPDRRSLPVRLERRACP